MINYECLIAIINPNLNTVTLSEQYFYYKQSNNNLDLQKKNQIHQHTECL